MKSTTRLVKEASELCYKARNLELLNSNISTLSKKHGQLKASIQALVEQAMGWLEDIRKTEGTEKWLELIETLRTVTEGKVCTLCIAPNVPAEPYGCRSSLGHRAHASRSSSPTTMNRLLLPPPPLPHLGRKLSSSHPIS